MALHPYAEHVRAAQGAGPHRAWQSDDGPLPACTSATAHRRCSRTPTGWRSSSPGPAPLPRPRAILIASAHWESAPLTLSATAAGTPLVYDFGGFDPVYYRMRYPTPDATDLAARVAAVFPTAADWSSTRVGAWTTAPGCR